MVFLFLLPNLFTTTRPCQFNVNINILLMHEIGVRSTQAKKRTFFPLNNYKFSIFGFRINGYSTSIKWFQCIQFLIIVYVLCATVHQCNSALSIQHSSTCSSYVLCIKIDFKRSNSNSNRFSEVKFYAKRRLSIFHAIEIWGPAFKWIQNTFRFQYNGGKKFKTVSDLPNIEIVK